MVFVSLGALAEGTRNEGFRQWVEQTFHRPYGEVLERSAFLFDFFLERADEARQLLRSL